MIEYYKSGEGNGMRMVLDHKDPRFIFKMAAELFPVWERRPFSSLPTFCCVGTDKSTGDCLGPLVGTFLKEAGYPGEVFGTLESPVHANNLSIVSERLKNMPGLVVGIDAALGHKDEIGRVQVIPVPLRPGAGVHKKLPSIGHAQIIGMVNVGGFMEYMVLQNTNLSLVYSMAKAITSGILQFVEVIQSADQVATGKV